MSDTKRYTVTYKVAAAGSKYVYQEDANGHKAGDSHLSSGGHVWYSLSNGGEGQSYGFSSRDEEPFGPGSLTLHDDAAYQETLYEVTLAVSQERYEKLIDFSKDPARYGFDQGTYNLLTNSCVDFAYASLKVLGYNEDDFQGDLLPSSNVDNLHTLFMKHGANIIRDDLRRRGEYYEDQDAQACLWLGNHEQIIRKTLSQSTSAVRVMKFHYPIRRPDKAPFTDANELYKALERETAGHYLLGSHGFWHGGIHITDRSAPHCVLDDPLRCMADGEVVAYRLNDDYRETTFGNGESAKKLKYSNSFCLIRHEYRSAPNPEEGANHGKQNTLNFYSLYMHLLPYHHYRVSPDEKPAPKVTMTVGDFNAYEVAPAPGLKPHCYGQLASGTQLEILGRAQNGDVTYAQGKIITGSVKNGSSSTRGEGDEVWFAYLKNNEPYQNASGQRIWTADALPERVRPCYWQGKVRATALRRLPLHDEPVKQSEGEPAGARIGKGELCVSSVVEFDSRGVVTLEFGGRPQRMAQCTLVSGGCWGPESVPPTFWTVVDDNFLRWETVTPTVFNSVVATSTRIKAGDPIGYLGLIENLKNEQGETESKHQVHLELFTADADVHAFLQNAAGLKTGKQHLHLPSGTVLRKHAPSSESVTLTQPHALELSKTPLVQDGGEDCYEVRVMERDQVLSGLLMKADAQIITQHDWEKLGFQIVEEQNPVADGFLDVEAMPPFFQSLFAKLDTNRDGTLSAGELKAALRNPSLRDQWARLVAHHPTEWKEKAASPKWSRLNQLLEAAPKTLKHEKQRIDSYVFWDELPAALGLASGLVCHFHPIAFIEAMRGSLSNATPLTGPGFYIVPRSMSGEQVVAELGPALIPAARERLRVLNPTFAQGFKAGELFVLGDPLGDQMCTNEEAQLMLAASQARTALEPLSPAEADFMATHQAEIAGMLSTASLSMGVGKDVFESGLKQIGSTLEDLEHLHQREFTAHGHLRSPAFFTSRQHLYRQLDLQLKATFLNKRLGLGSYDTLRRDLGISTRSLVHHWSQAGAPGQIPGYASHLDEVAKVAKYLKYGGHFAIAVGGVSSALKVQEVCRAGETEACQKIRFTEAGSFVGGLAGSSLGVWLAGPAGAAICVALGVPTMGTGTLVCGLVAAGAGSYIGAKGGGWGGEWVGEWVYGAQE